MHMTFGQDTYLRSKKLSCRSNFIRANSKECSNPKPNTYYNRYPKCNILPNITP